MSQVTIGQNAKHNIQVSALEYEPPGGKTNNVVSEQV